MKIVLLMFFVLFSFTAQAVTIEFPEDELARESVLPVFDNAVAVKSRLVPTAKRIEIGLGGGFAMNEPFFNSTRFGGHAAYHFTETHAVLLQAQIYSEGLGTNGTNLSQTQLNNDIVRMELAPQPKNHFMANYQITPYYGKISVFKDFVMNLSLYGNLGVGMIDVGGESTPAFNIGIGQKFYFSKNWGIRADMGLMAYNGVNFFVAADGGKSPLADDVTNPPTETFVNSPKSPGDFQREMNYDLNMAISLIILI